MSWVQTHHQNKLHAKVWFIFFSNKFMATWLNSSLSIYSKGLQLEFIIPVQINANNG